MPSFAQTRMSDDQAAAELRREPGYLQASDDPWEATWQTVEYMCRLVEDSLPDGIVQRACADAENYRQGNGHIWASIWWWVKHHLRFVHHQKLLVAWLGLPDELQLLIRPDVLLKMLEPKGDCAVYTTLICAMLDCAGLRWEIVTVAVDPRNPGVFSHVYPRVILENGQRVPLDASHGKFPGWEVPDEHVSAKQIWDMNGQPIEDQAPARFEGLHGVPMNYLYGGRDRRGLGQDDSDDGGDDSSTSSTTTSTQSSSGTTSPLGPTPDQLFGSTSDCAYGGTYPDCNPGPTSTSTTGTTSTTGGNTPLSVPSSIPSTAAVTGSSNLANEIATDIAAATAGATNVLRAVNGTSTGIALNGTTLLIGLGLLVGLVVLMEAGNRH